MPKGKGNNLFSQTNSGDRLPKGEIKLRERVFNGLQPDEQRKLKSLVANAPNRDTANRLLTQAASKQNRQRAPMRT